MGSQLAIEYLIWRFTNEECAPNYLHTYATLGGQLHIYNDIIIKSAIDQGRLDSVKYLVNLDPAKYKRPILIDTLVRYCIYKGRLDIADYLSSQYSICG